MALTDTAPEIASDTRQGFTSESADGTAPVIHTGLDAVLGSTAHRMVGRIFVLGALAALVIDLLLAAMVHLDIGGDIVFDQAVMARIRPNHQLALLLDVISLMLGLAIIVVPRQVGSATLAFPRAAAAAAWTWVLSALIWAVAIVADGSYGGSDETMARLGNVAFGAALVALVLAAVCVVTTVLTHRAPGLRLADVPFFSFSMLVAGTILILSLPSAFAHIVIGHITHANPASLLELTYSEGLTWLFWQPAIWVVVIPVLGVAADIVAHLSGAQQRFRGVVYGALGVMGFAAFGAWAQSDASRNTFVWIAFALLAALPPMAVLGAIFDTLRSGSPKVASPIAFAVLAVLMTFVAVVPGVLLAIDTVGDGQLIGFGTAALAEAQFVFAIGAAVIAGLGGCVYWARLVFNAPLSEGMATALGPTAALGVLLFGLPLAVVGLITPELDVVQVFEIIAAIGALLLALVVLGALAGGVATLAKARRGDDLLADPWGRGGTLEWSDAAFPIDPVESPYPLMPATDESGGA
ncbi:MAG TPA: cbb3-type cytochrome c oxidase subunit I [Microthrixaceae bacterium]|nr:cbb3-type cytochrome c oxidase subunit I [Microthrixaceae bacterium]